MIRAAFKTSALSIALVCAPFFVQADAAMERLLDALDVTAYVEITRVEGLSGIDSLAEDMIGTPPTPGLQEQMRKIYDAGRMQETVRQTFEDSLKPEQIAQMLIFLESDTGQRIAELELAARKAFTDTDLEDAAKDNWFAAEETHPWLVARIVEIKQISDLVDRNVSGALNSNLRFYQGLADGGALQLSEPDMLREVWGQEEMIRADTTAWLGGFLMLAYEPLSEQDIADYIAFWSTDTGKALNSALFDGFNSVYNDVSYATGRVIALNMGSQEL